MKILLFLALVPLLSYSLDNGLGLTPPMGWNPHNFVNGNFNESLTIANAHALIDSGLAALGYVYVNLDDGWQYKNRTENGSLTWDPEKFPNGIPYLVNYVHNLGLKFGIYSGAGASTYKNLPGSLGHEEVDANLFAAWDIDYLKYDYYKDNWTIPIYERDLRMFNALNKTQKPIYYGNSGGGIALPWVWGHPILNSWRITLDINDNWSSIPRISEVNALISNYGKIGAWNDADMLEVGNGGMTPTEYQSHFALWAFFKSPLLIGANVPTLDAESMKILSNKEIIAINQDPLGKPAARVSNSDGKQIWGGEVTGGYAALLFNKGDANATIVAKFNELGLKGPLNVRDLIAQKDLGVFDTNFTAELVSHGVVAIKLTATSLDESVFIKGYELIQ